MLLDKILSVLFLTAVSSYVSSQEISLPALDEMTSILTNNRFTNNPDSTPLHFDSNAGKASNDNADNAGSASNDVFKSQKIIEQNLKRPTGSAGNYFVINRNQRPTVIPNRKTVEEAQETVLLNQHNRHSFLNKGNVKRTPGNTFVRQFQNNLQTANHITHIPLRTKSNNAERTSVVKAVPVISSNSEDNKQTVKNSTTQNSTVNRNGQSRLVGIKYPGENIQNYNPAVDMDINFKNSQINSVNLKRQTNNPTVVMNREQNKRKNRKSNSNTDNLNFQNNNPTVNKVQNNRFRYNMSSNEKIQNNNPIVSTIPLNNRFTNNRSSNEKIQNSSPSVSKDDQDKFFDENNSYNLYFRNSNSTVNRNANTHTNRIVRKNTNHHNIRNRIPSNRKLADNKSSDLNIPKSIQAVKQNRNVRIDDNTDLDLKKAQSDNTATPSGGCQAAFTVRKGLTKKNDKAETHRVYFKELLTNVGSVWESGAQEFVTPCKGLYFFTFNAVSTDKEDFTIALMKNRDYQVTAYGGKQGYQWGSNSAVLKLFPRDKVYLELQQGDIYEHPHNESYVTFTGYLVTQL